MKTGLTNWTMTDEQKDAVSSVSLFSKTQRQSPAPVCWALKYYSHALKLNAYYKVLSELNENLMLYVQYIKATTFFSV